MIMLLYGKYGAMPPFDNLLEDWGHGGLRKQGFFGMCTIDELRMEVSTLKHKFPELVKMNIKNSMTFFSHMCTVLQLSNSPTQPLSRYRLHCAQRRELL